MENTKITDLVMLLASAQGVFLGVFILHKFSDLMANRFLATMMFLHSILLLEMSLQGLMGLGPNTTLVMCLIGISFTAGPLHFLYAKYLSQPGLAISKREFIHFIPFLIFEILVLLFYHPAAVMETGHSTISLDAEWLKNFGYFHLAVVIQYGSYLIQTQRILSRYSKRVEDVFSTLEQIKLTWLRNITWLALVVVGVYGLEYLLLMLGVGTGEYFAISSILMVLYVYTMGYLGLFKSEVLSSSPLREAFEKTEEVKPQPGSPSGSQITAGRVDGNAGAKYSKSGMSEEDLNTYKVKLLAVMEDQSPQSESSLTLDQLSGLLGLSPHNLSEVINRGLGLNFFDFVNGYRVKQVQKSLLDPKKSHLTVLALSLDAGFASKSTFNSIFKKQTGLTPTAWRRDNSPVQ